MSKMMDTDSIAKLAKKLDDRAKALVKTEEDRAMIAEAVLDGKINKKVDKTKLTYISVKDFGAIGDGITDDTIAFQEAINNSSSNGVSLYVEPGRYLISDTLNITNAGFTIFGANSRDSLLIASENFGNGTEFKPILNISQSNLSNAIDKINISDLGFNAENNTTNCRGIRFEFLIYSSSFINLNFDYFSGSCMYSEGTHNDVSEMITFQSIKMNPYTKILAEPQMNFKKLNESIFYNCRFFGEQKNTGNDINYPLLNFYQCQGITIISNSFFYTNNASAIKFASGIGNNGQGLFIKYNTFERCAYENLIEVTAEDGRNGLAIEEVDINLNRTLLSPGVILLNNVRMAIINDPFISVKLTGVVDGSIIYTNTTYGFNVIDETTDCRNTFINVGGDYNKSNFGLTNQHGSYVGLQGGYYPNITFKPVNSDSKKIEISTGCLYSDFYHAYLNILFDGKKVLEMNQFGIKINTVDTLPSPRDTTYRSLYLVKSEEKDRLYICIKDGSTYIWKEICSDLELLQPKYDDTLNTEDKTIVGAINELDSEVFDIAANVISLDNYKLDKTDERLTTENKDIVAAINEIKEATKSIDALTLNGYSLWVGTTSELNAIANRDPNTLYFEIDDGTGEEVVSVPIVDGVLSLTADKYQKTTMVSGTTIEFPTVDKFTEIHLYFDAEIDMALNFPDCKWRVEPNIEAGKSYEVVCTYNTINWLVNVIVYS